MELIGALSANLLDRFGYPDLRKSLGSLDPYKQKDNTPQTVFLAQTMTVRMAY